MTESESNEAAAEVARHHRRQHAQHRADFKEWNERLAAEGLPVIDVSTHKGVNSQLGHAQHDDAPDSAPRQLPRLTEAEAELIEHAFTARGSIRAVMNDRGVLSSSEYIGGFGRVGRTRKPRPKHYVKGPLRVFDQCDEPGCDTRVEGYRKSKRYCPDHATPAAKMRRRRATTKACYPKSGLMSERNMK